MADLIKKIKIKKQDGTFTDYIPIGADAINVSTEDGDSVQLKINKKPYYYDTVADMKADTKLKVGDMAVTLGYYEANDGGRAEYKIVNIANNNIWQEQLNNDLYADLIIKNELNVLQCGISSAHSNETILKEFFNKIPNNVTVIFNPNETYNIDFEILYPTEYVGNDRDAIRITNKHHITINFNSCTFIVAPNGFKQYTLLDLMSCDYITLKNGIFKGDKIDHDYTTVTSSHEYGHGIKAQNNIINTNMHIEIINMDISFFTGDGIYLATAYGGGESKTLIEDCKIYSCRRQGISLTDSDTVIIKNTIISKIGSYDNITGTRPGRGIDIEPENGKTFIADNVILENTQILNTTGASIGFYNSKGLDTTGLNNLYINNCYLANKINVVCNNSLYIANSKIGCTGGAFTENERVILKCKTDNFFVDSNIFFSDSSNPSTYNQENMISTSVSINNSHFVRKITNSQFLYDTAPVWVADDPDHKSIYSHNINAELENCVIKNGSFIFGIKYPSYYGNTLSDCKLYSCKIRLVGINKNDTYTQYINNCYLKDCLEVHYDPLHDKDHIFNNCILENCNIHGDYITNNTTVLDVYENLSI